MILLKYIFSENTLGILLIGMLLIATIFLYTDSLMIQKVGLIYGCFVFIILVGFGIRLILEGLLALCRYVKSKVK